MSNSVLKSHFMDQLFSLLAKYMMHLPELFKIFCGGLIIVKYMVVNYYLYQIKLLRLIFLVDFFRGKEIFNIIEICGLSVV